MSDPMSDAGAARGRGAAAGGGGAAAAFDELADDLRGRGVVAAKLFGKHALKYESKAFACLLRETLAFKLGTGTAEHAAALGLAGAELFDPAGKGRPMKDWVAVPVTYVDRWRGLALVALSRAGGAGG